MIAAKGDQRDRAFKYFFNRPNLRNSVIQKIIARGGNRVDAEDALQEGFRFFHRNLIRDKYRGQGTLYNYFSGICIRCWLDTKKKSFYKNTTLSGDTIEHDKDIADAPDVKLFDKERKEKLREMLAFLGQQCLDVILLKYKGYSDEEIKNELGLPDKPPVRKIRFSCMQRLHKEIQKEPHLLEVLKSLKNG
ncbi:hypothetical protein CRP01_33410 [Flavilitoribacter nigricans DSM 23189 = NBRC 102662]|uniref:Sigma-70 family RNA polymerase sigma factor n=2 Tax=Flavilitoribacter TaxID=2762562 RepID=A0A2D0N145_FLAN2|nr:hypothetical protein CRP01_33410 [Flavilitoribacter nigricans DSM 23189 = NBRC 102662]